MPTWSVNDVLNLAAGLNNPTPSGGGTIQGGTLSGDSLFLVSSSNATKGSVVVSETTVSSSVSTGALTVVGGMGVGGTLYSGTLSSTGASTVTSINKVAFTGTTTSSTLAVANGQTLTANGNLTFTGTDASPLAFGTGGTVVLDALAQTLTNKTLTSPTLSGATLIDSSTATTVNKVQFTQPASSASLTLGGGVVFTCSSSLTFTGSDSTVALSGGGTAIYTINNLAILTPTLSSALLGVVSGTTGTGSLMFSAGSSTMFSPTLSTLSITTSMNASAAYYIGSSPYLAFFGGSGASPSNVSLGPTNLGSAPGSGNTTIGYFAGGSGMTSAAANNTMVGYSSGANLVTGFNNTLIGSNTGLSLGSGTDNTFVGASADGGVFRSIALGVGATATLSDQFVLPAGITALNASSLASITTGSVLTLPVGTSTLGTTSTTQTWSLKYFDNPTTATGPSLGVALATSVNGLSITSTSSAALTIANAVSPTLGNTLTYTAAAASTLALRSGGTAVYTSNNLSVLTPTLSSALASVLSDETGSGNLVFSASPALVSPTLGTAVSTATSVDMSVGYYIGGSLYLTSFGGSAATPQNLAIGPTNLTVFLGACDRNTIIGQQAGNATMSNTDNTIVGVQAGVNLSTGSNNTFVGYQTGYTTGPTTGGNNTIVGMQAGYQLAATASENTIVGYAAGAWTSTATPATRNTYIGVQAGYGNPGSPGTGVDNTFVGHATGISITTGNDNVAVGLLAAQNLDSGSQNTLLGLDAGQSLTSHTDNVMIGQQAGGTATSSFSVFVGHGAGLYTASTGSTTYVGYLSGLYATGTGNTYFGYQAGVGLLGSATGTNNTFIGSLSGYGGGTMTTATNNVFVGRAAAYNITTGNRNTIVGRDAALGLTSGSDNTAIGMAAGQGIITENQNTCVGYATNTNVAGIATSISIGGEAKANANNQFAIGDTVNYPITHLRAAGLDSNGTGYAMPVTSSTMRAASGVNTFATGTVSSSSTTGTLVVTGGLGVSGTLNVGALVGNFVQTAFGTATPTLGTSYYQIFKGTGEQNNWTTTIDLARVTVTGQESVLVADKYSGGKTIVTLDSANNYGGKVVLWPGKFPSCHLFMRDSVNLDRMNDVGYNAPVYADVQMQAKLVPGATAYAATGTTSRFGAAIGMDYFGRTLVVGGWRDNPNGGLNVGAVWFYNRSATGSSFAVVGGGKQTGINMTLLTSASLFGHAIAVSADNTTVVVGGQQDNGLIGAVWVYNTLGTALSGKITATGQTGGNFGVSVAIDATGQTIAVGCNGDNGAVGATWVFYKTNATTWTQVGSKLVGTGATGPSHQGIAVALSYDGNTLVSDGSLDNSVGAAWVFTRTNGTGSGSTWTQAQPKIVPTGNSGNPFCESICMAGNGNIFALGGYFDNSGRGAVWIFEKRQGGQFVQSQPKLFLETLGTSSSAYFGIGTSLTADGSTLAVGAPNLGANGAVFLYFRQSNGYYTRRGFLADALLGTGATGAFLGSDINGGVALSGLGNILAAGGDLDNSGAGAVWVFK